MDNFLTFVAECVALGYVLLIQKQYIDVLRWMADNADEDGGFTTVPVTLVNPNLRPEYVVVQPTEEFLGSYATCALKEQSPTATMYIRAMYGMVNSMAMVRKNEIDPASEVSTSAMAQVLLKKFDVVATDLKKHGPAAWKPVCVCVSVTLLHKMTAHFVLRRVRAQGVLHLPLRPDRVRRASRHPVRHRRARRRARGGAR
jgi:hypothetical protein